jgi:hypothetical protein
MHPHHRPSWADGIVAPVPGLLAGGPDQYLDDAVLKRHFNTLTPPALCYIDSAESYACNEIAINWNSPLVFVLGYFNGEGLTSIDDQGYNSVPQKFELDQNYPNPFNPVTNIRFSIPKENFVTLKIYNVVGEEIATLVNEEIAAGSYSITWNGEILPSGVYYYKITTSNSSMVKKMVLIK